MSSVRLLQGDCLTILPTLADVQIDAIVSDPPYGMRWDGKITRGPNGKGKRGPTCNYGKTIINDDKPFDPSPWLCFPKVVLFGYNHFAQRLPSGTILMWLKRYDDGFGSFLSDGELAWMKGGCGVYAKRDTSLLGQTHQRSHVTQKPVSLMRWCLDMAKIPVGATVLDPYAGSGSTGVACVQTGRNFIGIELDADYFKIAERRINEALLQPRLFEAETPRPSVRPASLDLFADTPPEGNSK